MATDLALATRELFIRTVKEQVFMRTPFLEELLRRNQITHSAGKFVERLTDRAEMTELGQSYSPTEPLTDEKKNMLEKPRFTWKYYQMPMRYDVEEWSQNHHGGSEIQLLDLAAFLVRKAQRGVKLALRIMLFNADPATDPPVGSETGRADNSKIFQSLLSALDHDVTTYGTVSRTLGSTTTGYWHGSDPEGRPDIVSSSSQGTAFNLSIARIRKWIIPIQEYMDSDADLYMLMCPTLYNKLREEMESKLIYKPTGDMQKQGFMKMELDGHTIATDPWLENGYGTAGTTENWVFLLNLPDWELRFHSMRNFKVTDFKWQGEISNGYDYWLGRILLLGNFMCWKPNGSMFLQNVS